jgi:hypothetical protein
MSDYKNNDIKNIRDKLRKNRIKNFFNSRDVKTSVVKYTTPSTTASVFNNPQINAAYDNLSDKEKNYYKEAGKSMYNTDMISDPLGHRIKESYAYIKTSLDSGLDPKELTVNEVHILEECAGKDWYSKFGYSNK